MGFFQNNRNSKVYNYQYDLEGRETLMQYPDQTSETYAYDAVGNQISSANRAGSVRTVTFDSRNRQTNSAWNDGITPAFTTSYDSCSRVTALSNANSTVNYGYDDGGQILTESQTLATLTAKTVSYSYNSDGTIAGMTYPDGNTVNYSYDNRNDITSVNDSDLGSTAYFYDVNSNLVERDLPNNTKSTMTYDTLERLNQLVDTRTSPSAPIQQFNYGYDAMSRRTYSKRDGALGDVYSYDNTGQISTVRYDATNPDTAPSNPSHTATYSFDQSGNRTNVSDSVAGATSYVSNSVNQYASVNGVALGYDSRGNLTSFAGGAYSYDADGRILSATNGTNTTTFSYDPLGRCVKRIENGVATFFIHDREWSVIGDYNLSGSEVSRYVRGPGRDEIIAKIDGSGAACYYHTDGFGSVTRLTDDLGTTVEQYRYDIFGQPTIFDGSGAVIIGSSWGNRFMFHSQQFLGSLDLYDNRERGYSPQLGRFLQPDPIGHAGDTYNVYRYCYNDPLNLCDSLGSDAHGLMSNDANPEGDSIYGVGNHYSYYIGIPGIVDEGYKSTAIYEEVEHGTEEISAGPPGYDATISFHIWTTDELVSPFQITVIASAPEASTSYQRFDFTPPFLDSTMRDFSRTMGAYDSFFAGVTNIGMSFIPVGDFVSIGKAVTEAAEGFEGVSSHELSNLTSTAAKDWIKGKSDVVPSQEDLLRLQEIAKRAVEAGKQSATNPVQSQRLLKIQEALKNSGGNK